MNSTFYFSKAFNMKHDVPMNYQIQRAGDLSPNSSKLFVAKDQMGYIIMYDIKKGKLSFSHSLKWSHMSLKLCPRKRYILTGCSNKYLIIWNSFTGKMIKRFSQNERVTNISTDVKANKSVSICHAGSILIIDLNTLQIINYYPNLSKSLWIGSTVDYDFDNNTLICQKDHYGWAMKFDIRKTKKSFFSFDSLENRNFYVGIKSKKYVVGYDLGFLLYNSTTMKLYKKRKEFPFKKVEIICLTLDKSEKFIFLGCGSGHMVCYDVRNRIIHFVIKQEKDVFFMRLCSNKDYMISCGELSSPLRVWHVETCLKKFEGNLKFESWLRIL